MGLLTKIKLFFEIKDAIKKLQEESKVSHNYFSTEFVSKVVVQVLTIIGMLQGFIPANWALIIIASLTGLYMVLRTIYKIKNPGQDLPELPQIAGVTTTTTVTTGDAAVPK